MEKNKFSPRVYTKSPLDAFRIVIFFTSVAFIIIAVKVSCVVTVVENITSREYFALKCKSLNRKGDTFRFAERRDRGLFGVSRCFFYFPVGRLWYLTQPIRAFSLSLLSHQPRSPFQSWKHGDSEGQQIQSQVRQKNESPFFLLLCKTNSFPDVGSETWPISI